MMDHIFENITPDWIILQAFLMNIIVLPYILQIKYNTSYHNIILPKRYFSSGIIFMVLIVFCLFASYDGDYWSYLIFFKELSINIDSPNGMEEFYLFIIDNRLIDSYLYFRLVVWGGGLSLYWLSFQRLAINNSLIWLIFTATTLLSIAYIRAFLGMGFFLYGYTFLIKPSRYKILSHFMGLCIVCLSFFLHKSMFLIIVCALLSVWLDKNWILIVSAISFPLLSKLLVALVIASIGTDIEGLNYLETETTTRGIGAKLYEYMRFVFVVGCLAYVLLQAYKRKLPLIIRKCTFLGYYIFYIYVLFYIVFERNGIGRSVICDRIFVMLFTIIPILYYYCIKTSKRPIWFVLGLWLATLAFNYKLIYAYYLQSMNLGMNIH